MAFQYRLETVLTVRKNKEEQAQYKLAHEISILENKRQHLMKLSEQRLDLVHTIEEKKKQPISGSMYSFYTDSLQNIDRQIAFQKNAIRVQEQVMEKARGVLAAKVKEKRIVEKMKEKDYLEYVQELLRKEQIEHDEMAVLRHGRGHGQ